MCHLILLLTDGWMNDGEQVGRLVSDFSYNLNSAHTCGKTLCEAM